LRWQICTFWSEKKREVLTEFRDLEDNYTFIKLHQKQMTIQAAFIIPEINVTLNKRVNDQLSVFTVEMLAIILVWLLNSKARQTKC